MHTELGLRRGLAVHRRTGPQRGSVRETDVQQRHHAITFRRNGLTTYHPPIVAANAHSGDPHYETGTGHGPRHQPGDFVLIDLWAKLDQPRRVYSDLTRVGFVGETVPAKYEQDLSRSSPPPATRPSPRSGTPLPPNEPLQGWQVDQACRDVIDQAGYGQYFCHRTGHSIGQEVHGNGANMDNLETHEERPVLPRTCFSIEPGIYLPEFGVRSEVDVFVDGQGKVHVTGGELQRSVVRILI